MIILINGSINAGKTTVARILAKKILNVALVEVDVIRNMIKWMTIGESVPINLENAISATRNFTKRGLNVIVPYPLSQKNYDYVLGGLKDLDTKIYTFTLAPKIEKALTNRGARELDDSERERIKYHYKIGIHTLVFGEVIDNSEQTPEETAEIILSKIEN